MKYRLWGEKKKRMLPAKIRPPSPFRWSVGVAANYCPCLWTACKRHASTLILLMAKTPQVVAHTLSQHCHIVVSLFFQQPVLRVLLWAELDEPHSQPRYNWAREGCKLNRCKRCIARLMIKEIHCTSWADIGFSARVCPRIPFGNSINGVGCYYQNQ